MKTSRFNLVLGTPAARWLLALMLGLLCIPFGSCAADSAASGTNESPAIQLRSVVQVDGAGIFLSQLLAGNSELPVLRLCDAPPFGKSVALKRAEVAELVGTAGWEQPLTNWAGAQVARVSRRARPLAEAEMLQMLTSILQKQFVKNQGELELRLSRPWTPANVPDEPFTFKVLDIPTTGVAPAFIARFELETAHGEHIGAWQASLQAKVWREVWVAGSTIKRGDSVQGAPLIRERRDLLLCHEPLADFASDDAALEFFESVQAGSPIFVRFIRPRAVVHRGQSVAAMVQDGPMTITLKVEALEDGAAGQMIRVRNPLSRRDLHGKVLDAESVLVSL